MPSVPPVPVGSAISPETCTTFARGSCLIRGLAGKHGAVLLSNHGPVVSGADLEGAILAVEDVIQGQGGEAGGAASFNALQQRLGRKVVSKKMLADYPAFVRLYDVLMLDGADLRELPWADRRLRLEELVTRLPASHFDISQVLAAATFDDLATIRAGARDEAIEGLMLKRRDSPYIAGRRVGLWYKWKRDPLLVDCVLMYAQRGSGKRSSYYSDYTFGCWRSREDGHLHVTVPARTIGAACDVPVQAAIPRFGAGPNTTSPGAASSTASP